MHAALDAHRQQLLYEATVAANKSQPDYNHLTRRQIRSIAEFAETLRANLDQLPNQAYGPASR
jgi:hypothetical protein